MRDTWGYAEAGFALRWTRATILGLVAMLVGSLSHASAGGLLPGPTALLLLTLCVTLGCGIFLGRVAGTLRIVTLLVAGQAFIHLGLSAFAGHVGQTHAAHARLLPASETAGLAGELGMPTVVSHGLVAPSWLASAAAEWTGPGAWMAAAHLVAAAAVGVWLAIGERALWHVIALLAGAVVRLVSLPVLITPAPAPLRASYAAVDAGLSGVRRIPLRLLVRRGPPALLTLHA